MAKQHPNHSASIKRLNRIQGQVEGVRNMIEERRYCPDILNQTRAIRSALKSLEATILEKHIEHCVKDAFQSKQGIQEKIDQLVHLYKKNP